MSYSKKKILVFVDWYLPGFKAGGPIRSIVGMTDRLSFKYDIRIVTGNTDLKDPVPYKGIPFNTWTVSDAGTNIFYCTKSFLNIKNIGEIINSEKPDVIYLNSMYSFNYTLLPLIALRLNKYSGKVIIAPRGMLSKGALELKPFKKKSFLVLSKMLGIFKNVIFHASTEIEVAETRSAFNKNTKIFHAMDLTPKNVSQEILKQKDSGIVNLIFLGRISKVKNLLQAIKLLKKVDNDYKINFDIYGPPEDLEYLNLCKNEVKSCPDHIHIQFKGEVHSNEVNEILKTYHFLFLLTKNENFGHSIIECLSASCPVIISDKTPWKQLNEKYCGWDLDLNDEKTIVSTLNKAAAMNQSEYDQYAKAAFQFSELINNNQKSINEHIYMFES